MRQTQKESRVSNLQFSHQTLIIDEGIKVTPTYDRHTAQRGDERRRGKAIGSEVPQLPDAHEDHAEPPHHGGVVGFGASLSLTEMSVFLRGGSQERAAWGWPLSCVSSTFSCSIHPTSKHRQLRTFTLSEHSEHNLISESSCSLNYF